MSSIRSIDRHLRPLLTTVADDLARATGLIQRQRTFSGSTLLQTFLFGWLENPDASLSQLATMAARLGVAVSPQALDQRFTPPFITFLDRLLDQLRPEVVAAPPVAIPLLRQFTAVYLLDTTQVQLPEAWMERWPGCGGRHGSGQAALKLSTMLDLLTGRLLGPLRHAGRVHDQTAAHAHSPLPSGSLRISDRAYFDLVTLQQLDALGSFWILRPRVGTLLVLPTAPLKVGRALAAWLDEQADRPLDVPIRLGGRQRLPARLIAERASPAIQQERLKRLKVKAAKDGRRPSPDQRALAGWNLWLTNLPVARADGAAVAVLAQSRWQLEWLFRFWKEHLGINRSRSAKPVRILAECYVKLLGALVLHWLTVATCWQEPERSLVKTYRQLRSELAEFGRRLNRGHGVLAHLTRMTHAVGRHCTVTKRRRQPSTAQLLLQPPLRDP
jgi:Transposase DDE domain